MNKLIIIFLLIVSVSSCKTTPEARKPVSVKTGSFIKESAERNKALIQKERTFIEALIAKDTTYRYIASENGFWYSIITATETTTPKAEFGDLVKFDYDISDLNGNTIYAAETLKTKTYAMDQEELFSGLREGLKLMQAGETYQFIFPSQKAFGYYGDEDKIGANVPIKSKVTIHSITKK